MWEFLLSIVKNNIDKIIITVASTLFVQIIIMSRRKLAKVQYTISVDIIIPILFISLVNILICLINWYFTWSITKGEIVSNNSFYDSITTFSLLIILFLSILVLFSDILNLIILSNKFYIMFDNNDEVRFIMKEHNNMFKNTVEVASRDYFDESHKSFKVLKNNNSKLVYFMEKFDILVEKNKLFRIIKMSRRNLIRSWFRINGIVLSLLSFLPIISYFIILVFGKMIFDNNNMSFILFLLAVNTISITVRIKITNRILKENNAFKNKFVRERLWEENEGGYKKFILR